VATVSSSWSGYETVIGLEVHAQLMTRTKMYCSCASNYADAEPNTHLCPVCAGLPGALPVLNRTAVEKAILVGLALNCEIPPYNKLDRKQYVYPDLPKGYQISQYDMPLCVNGWLEFETGGVTKRAGITRVHVEEDTGRLVHVQDGLGASTSLVDLNRSGVPLLEIVGEPDLRSPEEAQDYLIALRQILRYIDASTGSMEDGAFRCDANVSVRLRGAARLGAKVEVKNMNSFSAVERALKFEEIRQREALDTGEVISQETRGWIEAGSITVSQRTKEQAHDYRYFPEPDLPPLRVEESQVAELQDILPELPAARRGRFVTQYRLKVSDAALLTAERPIADDFEAVVGTRGDERARITANWIVNDVLGLQRQLGLPPEQLPVSAAQLGDLIDALTANELSSRAAKDVLAQLRPDELPRAAAARLNLLSLNDDGAVDAAVSETLAAFPEAVTDYQSGKTNAIGRLIGETIKRTGGRARPEDVRARLEHALAARE